MASISGFVSLKSGKRVSINSLLHMKDDREGKDKASYSRENFKKHFNSTEVNVPPTVYEELSDRLQIGEEKIPKTLIVALSTAPDFDKIIEYSIDEEDTLWISKTNKERKKENLKQISFSIFEEVMDRLEKKSKFEVKTIGAGPQMDSDDVCCVCGDGDTMNANQIIYCDMCNIAVHQDCYGVPYIPEGAWYCRRCKWSPSKPVKCCLCPNQTGAFKRTSDSRWVHVVCAIWLNEVHFANTTFLEPVLGVNKCLEDRKSLRCEICKIKNGACIQCSNRSCYKAYHVTCAQKAGIGMKILNDPTNSDLDVQRYIYCFKHIDNNKHLTKEDVNESYKRASRNAVASSTHFKPTVNLPKIGREAIDKIQEKAQIGRIDEIVKFWFLKRKQRLGAPLIRRLQVEQQSKPKTNRLAMDNMDEKDKEIYSNTSRLRQSLETARLLSELVKKREVQKKNLNDRMERLFELSCMTSAEVIEAVLETLSEKDPQGVFASPVALEGYSNIIKHPMDLSTMKKKFTTWKYTCVADVRTDVILMTDNCSKFNFDNHYYLDYGRKYRKSALKVLEEAEKDEKGLAELDLTEDQIMAFFRGGSEDVKEQRIVEDGQVASTSNDEIKTFSAVRKGQKSKKKVEEKEEKETIEEPVESVTRSSSRRGKYFVPVLTASPKKRREEVKEEIEDKPKPTFGQKNPWTSLFGSVKVESGKRKATDSDVLSPKRKKVEKKGNPAANTRSITAFMVPNGQRSTFNSILASAESSPNKESPMVTMPALSTLSSRLRNTNKSLDNIFDYRENSVKSPLVADTASSEESTDDDALSQTGDKVTPPAKRAVGKTLNNTESAKKTPSTRKVRLPKNTQTDIEKAREESRSKYAHNALVDADGKAARVISMNCIHLEGFSKEKRQAVLQARPQSQNKIMRGDEDSILVHLFSDRKELWIPASRVSVLDMTNTKNSVVGFNKAKQWFQKLTDKK